jgi:uncharacterized protein YpuA (DUF1002 family)
MKETIEQEIRELKAILTQSETDYTSVKARLAAAEQNLEEVNRPTLTKSARDLIRDAVEQALRNFNFSEPDDYECDFSINYNNQLEVDNISFNSTDELEEEICSYIEESFKIIEDAE